MAKSEWTTRPLDDEWGEILRAELLSWPRVTARPVMGALAFFHGKLMLGCYVNRALSKTKPDWLNRRGEPTFAIVRLCAEDAGQALKRKGVRPSRLGFDGWLEIDLTSRKTLEEAVRWFGTAYEHPPSNKSRSKKKSLRKKTKKTAKRKTRR